MKLTQLRQFQGEIELLTGLHIGAGVLEVHIGGTDNPVIKHPLTGEPYIPGSSLKGKMRSLLEWHTGVLDGSGKPLGYKRQRELTGGAQAAGRQILSLFGGAPEGAGNNQLAAELGPTRLAFWDCPVSREWLKKETRDGEPPPLSEIKMENIIDRIQGVAQHPRSTERVPAGTRFAFRLTLRVHDADPDLVPMVFTGLSLVQLCGLGGSGSRGYGKLQFASLALDGEDVRGRLESAAAAASA